MNIKKQEQLPPARRTAALAVLKSEYAVFNITVEIASKEQLEQLSKKISQIPGVHEIVRTSNG